MDYDNEQDALVYTLRGQRSDVRRILRELTTDELDHFSDALDTLAALVDHEAVRRVEKRA